MRRQWLAIIAFASLISLAQDSAWQHGVITAVTEQPAAETSDISKYDISIRVGDTVYLVLYTAPRNTSVVQYRVGADLPVLVEGAMLTVNDLQGNAHRLQILRKQTTAPNQKP